MKKKKLKISNHKVHVVIKQTFLVLGYVLFNYKVCLVLAS